MKKILLLCLTLAVAPQFVRSQTDKAKIRINEIMPSNINGIMDDWNEFPDSWVELYNAGESTCDLTGWFLSNDKNQLGLWKIPADCKIPSKGYLILYLDKGDKDLHANFRLDIKGETLYLTRPDGKTIEDQVKFEKQEPNISFGRVKDKADQWGWFATATPGAPNDTYYVEDKKQIVPSVLFDVEGGVHTDPVVLELSPEEQKETFADCIYYTTDGSEPTPESSFHYTEPIRFDTTTILRAKIIHKDYLPKMSTTQSYLFPRRELTLPVMSLTTDPNYLYDDSIGIYTDGKNGAHFAAGNIEGYFNWAQDWRRPVNVEYYVEDENKINQIGEMRIMGGYSRANPQKSLAVYANKRFGEKRFAYSFFQEKEPLDGGYKSIMLRNSGQDFPHTFMRDAVNHYTAAGKMDIDYQAYQPAIVFLNGVYWGIHNIRERSNEDHIIANYDTEDIDMLENAELKAGDKENFNEMLSHVTSPDCTYEDLEKYLDIEETINYIILETFIANKDWPHNNIVMWRKRENGKWRWLLKDTDYCLSGHNMFEWIYTKNTVYSKIIKACLDNKKFQEQFIDRYVVYLGDFFKKEITTALVDSFTTQIATEMEYARPRWGIDVETWHSNITNLHKEMTFRQSSIYWHLHTFFEQGSIIPVTINTSIKQHRPYEGLIINKIPLYDTSFNGSFFSNRLIDIELADTPQNEEFKYWIIEKTGVEDGKSIEKLTDRHLSLRLDSTLKSINIQAVIGNSSEDVANETILVNSDLDVRTIFNGVIISSSTSRQIAIYTIGGRLFRKVNLVENNPIFIHLPNGMYIIERQKVYIK